LKKFMIRRPFPCLNENEKERKTKKRKMRLLRLFHNNRTEGNMSCLYGDVLVDFGPTGDWAKFEPGRNDWIDYSFNGKYKLISEIPGNKYSPIRVQGVNVDRLYKISARMNAKPGFYLVLTRSCSSTVSRALTISGVPAIGIHPYILHSQMYLRSIGARPMLYSHYLIH